MCMYDRDSERRKKEQKNVWSFQSSHLVFFLDGSSGLQQLLHHLHVSFVRGFVQRCSLELDIGFKKFPF